MEIKISNSEIQTFKHCRRRWYLTYYRKLGVKESQLKPTGALQLGTKIHYALELFYGQGVDPINTISQLYMEEIEKQGDNDLYLKNIDDEYKLADAMIRGYVEWLEETGIDQDLTFIATERVVEIPVNINGFDLYLRGKLDALVRRETDGSILFMDHKTTASLPQLSAQIHMNEQMKFYHLLEKMSDGEEVSGGLYNMLRKTKRTARAVPPFYDRVEVHHNDEEIYNMKRRVYSVIREILLVMERLNGKEDHLDVCYPSPSGDCFWKCPFVNVCNLADDGSNFELALENNFQYVDPHERYNTEEVKNA